MIVFKMSLSLGLELVSSVTRLGANFLLPAVRIRATGLPTKSHGHAGKALSAQVLAESSCLAVE